MRPKAVFFDFGHTLFDVRDPGDLVARTAAAMGFQVEPNDALRTWDAIAAAAGTPEELAEKRDLSARSHRTHWVRLLGPLDRLGDGLAEAVYEAHKSVENWASYPDSRPTLQSLKATGIPIVIVSDTGFDLRPILAHHFENEPLVDDFVLSFEIGAVKPDPVVFQAALRAVGARPEETLMVGDNPATDGGASSVGIPTLILPPAKRGQERGLKRVLHLAHP